MDNSNKKEYLTELNYINKNEIKCKILKENIVVNKINIDITLALGIPKQSKMDFIIEKATELGVSRIIPINTERTIPKIAINSNKPIRWKRIAKEASQQCGRVTLPLIDEVTDFDIVLREIKNYELALMPWEAETKVHIKDALKNNFNKNKIFVLIGPEGGFSISEVKKAKDNNVITVSLGALILRVETAAIITLGIINYEFGNFKT